MLLRDPLALIDPAGNHHITASTTDPAADACRTDTAV